MPNRTIPELSLATLTTGHLVPTALTAAAEAVKASVEDVASIINNKYFQENISYPAHTDPEGLTYNRFRVFKSNILVSGANLKVQGTAFLSGINAGHYIGNVITKPQGFSTILGGTGIRNSGQSSVICGGLNNQIGTNVNYGFVGGGDTNRVVGTTNSAIVGGQSNTCDGAYNFIGAGVNNSIDSASTYSIIGAGQNNSIVNSDFSVIAAGDTNSSSSDYTVIAGGTSNTIGTSATHAAIIGGQSNTVLANHSAIGGGISNYITLSAIRATIGGGVLNKIGDTNATIAGGATNLISGASNTHGFIGGGSLNRISGSYSTIGGGLQNENSGDYTTIAGGRFNLLSEATYSFIGGGRANEIRSIYSTIPGGNNNQINTGSSFSSIIGGESNKISAFCSYDFIGGGFTNTIVTGNQNVIGGGDSNQLYGHYVSIVGGRFNIITGEATSSYSFLGGGRANEIKTIYSVICGGNQNIASGYASSVLGGEFNYTTGSYSVTLGGEKNTTSGNFGLAAGRRSKSYHQGAFVFSDSQNKDRPSFDQDTIMFNFQRGAYFSGTDIRTSGANIYVNGDIITSSTSSTVIYKHGGMIYYDYSPTGNTAGGAPTIMKRYTLPANALKTNGDRLVIRSAGKNLGSGPPSIAFTFGGLDLLPNYSVGGTNVRWSFDAEIIRSGASNIRYNFDYSSSDTTYNKYHSDSTGIALNTNQFITLSGAGTTASDILADTMTIEYWPV